MSYELNFYGVTFHAFVRDGNVFLLRRDVAALFDVDNTDEMMEPLLPYVKDELISLPALQHEMLTMIQHVLGNTVAERKQARQGEVAIIFEELISFILKHLTYEHKVLPLVQLLPPLHSTGLVDVDIPGAASPETCFTLHTIRQLLLNCQPPVKIPQDVPFYFLLVRSDDWDSGYDRVTKVSVQKVIPLRYLGTVVKHNAERVEDPMSIFPILAKSDDE